MACEKMSDYPWRMDVDDSVLGLHFVANMI